MNVFFAGKFVKQYNKLPKKKQQQFDDRLQLFLSNRYDVLLRVHALKGKYVGYYSLDVSGDLRAVFRYTSDAQVIFSLIGTHSQLY